MTQPDPTAIGDALLAGNATDVIKRHVKQGGSIDAIVGLSGLPILHLCCEHQNLEAIRTCVGLGADINFPTASGVRPLHVATDADINAVVQANGLEISFETVKLLVSLGADPSLTDCRHMRPRDIALDYGGPIFGEEMGRRFDDAIAFALTQRQSH